MDRNQMEQLGDNHIATSIETPITVDAFEKSEDDKIKNIQYHFSKIMEELGFE